MAPNSKILIKAICLLPTYREETTFDATPPNDGTTGWVKVQPSTWGSSGFFGAMIGSKTMEWDALILGWDGISRLKMDEPSNNFSHFMNDTGQLDYISFQIRLHSLELLSDSPVSLYISI